MDLCQIYPKNAFRENRLLVDRIATKAALTKEIKKVMQSNLVIFRHISSPKECLKFGS